MLSWVLPISYSWSNVFALLIWALPCYIVVGAIRRLYFSPISAFPGPKLAALTLWYKCFFYVDGMISVKVVL